MGSAAVSWWDVHTFVAPQLETVGHWPMVGTPAWCRLSWNDPEKWAAILDAAQHWALRVETCQQAHCDASHAVSAAVNWTRIAESNRNHAEFYAERPWLKRRSS
jgi:hypothetical protein